MLLMPPHTHVKNLIFHCTIGGNLEGFSTLHLLALVTKCVLINLVSLKMPYPRASLVLLQAPTYPPKDGVWVQYVCQFVFGGFFGLLQLIKHSNYFVFYCTQNVTRVW